MSDRKFYTIDVKTAPVAFWGPWLTGTRHDVEVKLKAQTAQQTILIL